MDSPDPSRSTPDDQAEVRGVLCRLIAFALVLASIWLSLYSVARGFPFLASGETVIAKTKVHSLNHDRLLARGAARRVIVFGNSKALAGFIPVTFDALGSPKTSSHNGGLPGRTQFLSELEAMCARGEVPTHVLLLQPWRAGRAARSARTRSSFFHPLPYTDSELVNELFPFRNLPRDAAMFALRSRRQGGLATAYEKAKSSAQEVRQDHGYYFIAGQSVYPNDSLPSGFVLSADQPKSQKTRHVDTTSPDFTVLKGIAHRHDLQILLIPSYYREGECAPYPEPTNGNTEDLFRDHPHFQVVGPDYWLFPPSDFSDPVHLNRKGAERYTTMIWELTKKAIRVESAPDGAKPR